MILEIVVSGVVMGMTVSCLADLALVILLANLVLIVLSLLVSLLLMWLESRPNIEESIASWNEFIIDS